MSKSAQGLGYTIMPKRNVKRNRKHTHHGHRPFLELLEDRALPSTFAVTNTNDSGPGSLRLAILSANSDTGPGLIRFQIPGSGVHTIRLTSPLPEITNRAGVNLDGTTQTGYACAPLIELDGSLAGTHTTGLVISGGLSTVKGFIINRFTDYGILVQRNGNNVIQGNYLGTDATGRLARGNGSVGVYIVSGSRANLVGIDGTTDPCAGNLISGNGREGVAISDPGTNGNVVAGNLIGTDITGTHSVGNSSGGSDAVVIRNGAQNNRIGTDGNGIGDDRERNIISGNWDGGVTIADGQTNGNVVAGNYIGTDVTGTQALGNRTHGVWIVNGPQNNRIGVSSGDVDPTAEKNLIAANNGVGVAISGNGANQNVVAGNFIGTDITGTLRLGNGYGGVSIYFGPQFNRIGTDGDGAADEVERNLISANHSHGVALYSAGTNQNVVAGNFIGTDVNGTLDLGNAGMGILIQDGPQANRIGTNGTDPNAAGEGNLISANSGDGVQITGSGTNQNVVAGNFIGTDVTGTFALGNSGGGVAIYNGANANRVGTNGDGLGDAAERNLISGNRNSNGVAIGTNQNVVAGNFIGTDVTGTAPLGNRGSGVVLFGGAQANRIGVNSSDVNPAAEPNLISGNRNHGVLLTDLLSNQNMVAGNFIGTDVTGTVALPNGFSGVALAGGAKFNRIGTDGDCMGDDAERNVISGNTLAGVLITDSGTEQNVVAGNFIGITADGSAGLGNGWEGVRLQNGASRNVIGFNPNDACPADDRNVSSANGLGGVGIYDRGTDLNGVAGDFIGTDATRNGSLGNFASGVIVKNGPLNNTIGGTAIGEGNVIAHNLDNGVLVDAASRTPFLRNSIFDHPNGLGIRLLNGGNNNQAFPTLTSALSTDAGTIVQGTLRSAPSTMFRLEFFANNICNPSGFGEGEVYVDFRMEPTDPSGNVSFTVTLPIIPAGQFLTATATDPLGNTSEFSRCALVTRGDGPDWPGPGQAFFNLIGVAPIGLPLPALQVFPSNQEGTAAPTQRNLDAVFVAPSERPARSKQSPSAVQTVIERLFAGPPDRIRTEGDWLD